MTSATISGSTYTAVDLSKLPAPDVVEMLDYESILAQLVVLARSQMGDFTLVESDPATKLLQIFAYREMVLRQRVNDAARAVMVAFAKGNDLDNLGALFGVARFMLSPGDAENGVPPSYEEDEDFRRRMVLAPEGYSVAGPEGAYVFHAVSAHSDVLDASAYSPSPDSIREVIEGVLASHNAPNELKTAMAAALDQAAWPGQVNVSVLARAADGLASEALCQIVQNYLSAEARRPLTDYVIVSPAEIVPYAIDAKLWTFAGPDSSVVLAEAQRKIDAYTATSRRLGRDITRSGIYAALHVEGVQNVALASPETDIICQRHQAPVCTSVSLTYGGIAE